MSRRWDEGRFNAVYDDAVVGGTFQEVPEYYDRYRARYRDVMKLYAEVAPPESQATLEVGGGQLALLSSRLWGDRADVADIDGPHFDYLRSSGVGVFEWNLLDDQSPVPGGYDTVFFSEVIEHLPVAGHEPLAKLRSTLKPGGLLVCTTPNLYRPRNIVFLALGQPIFDHFRVPAEGGLGHVLEYSSDHLEWQIREAGFTEVDVRFHQVGHRPNKPIFRMMQAVGRPLFYFPRFRDNLFAVARNT